MNTGHSWSDSETYLWNKKCLSPKFSTINLTRSGRGSELLLRGETPATNCLSHCTVRSLERAVLFNVPDFRKNIAFWKASRLCHLSCWKWVCGVYRVLVGLYWQENTAVLGKKTCPSHVILVLSNIVHNNSVPTKQRTCYVTKTSRLTLILRRSRTGTIWFYTSTSNKRAAWPKLYTKSLTRDLKLMYSRLILVRISIKL